MESLTQCTYNSPDRTLSEGILYSMALRMSPSDKDDLVQVARIAMWKAQCRKQCGRPVLSLVAWNSMLEYMRDCGLIKKSRIVKCDIRVVAFDDACSAQFTTDFIDATCCSVFIAGLEPLERIVLTMYLNGFNTFDICKKLHRYHMTVKKIMKSVAIKAKEELLS